jgi:ribonucleoside-triphosphate reductase
VRRPTHVRKRDGRLVPFDEGRIADAIYRAALAVGGEDRFLAEELASMVTLFLAKVLAAGAGPGAGTPALPGMEADGGAGGAGAAAGGGASPVPTIEQVQDMVEKVLVDTGHARTAKAYILHRDRRARLREAARARVAEGAATLFDDRFLLVEDPSAERTAPFSAERLARTVAAEAGLDREAALRVVEGVEARLRRARVRRIPAPVLGSLVDAELLETGRLAEPRRRSGAAVPRSVIEEALSPPSRPGAAIPPETAARRLGGEVLRAHALAEAFPESVASAHLDGTIHVHGLARPGALHALTLSLDALKVEGVPGSGGRTPARASDGARRFLAQTGRAARTLRAYATHGLGVPFANLLLAPLLPGGPADLPDADALAEDAWHLLFEAAGDPDAVPTELDLVVEVPAALAGVPARGAGGRRDGSVLGDHGPRALALARAVVAARASGEGLPARTLGPGLNLVLGRAGLQDPRSREVLREALGAATRGIPLRLVLDRDGVPTAGTGLARERLEDAARLADPAAVRPFSCQRVTLNLPRAAFRVPPGDLAGFFRECDRAVDLALEAHRARRSLLATAAAGEGGALAPLFRRARAAAGTSPLDFSTGSWSVGVLGLNEAVAWLLGEELHEGDGAVKVGSRILGYLALRVREAGRESDLPAALDESSSTRAAGRFLALDRVEHREEQSRAVHAREGYTAGAGLRPGAPADLLRRLEAEGRLHGHLRTAAFRFDPAVVPGISDEGLLALVEKAWLHTAVTQIAFGEAA